MIDLPPSYHESFLLDLTKNIPAISQSANYDGSLLYASNWGCCMVPGAPSGQAKPPALLWPSWPIGQDWKLPSPFKPDPQGGLDMGLYQGTSPIAGNTCSAPAVCWVGSQIATASPEVGYSKHAPANGNTNFGLMWKPPFYMETTIELPTNPAPGAWDSFVLYAPKYVSQPSVPDYELDVMEANQTDGAAAGSTVHEYSSTTIHDWGHAVNDPATPMQCLGQTTTGLYDGHEHTYGVWVTVNTTQVYRDDKLVCMSATPPDSQQPLFPVWTAGVGPGWIPTAATANPAAMRVVNFRVYQPQ